MVVAYILVKPMDNVQAFEFDGTAAKRGLIDPFGRAISYLRVSVTDRCDFRCVYCMAENMSFLPKSEILTLGRTRPAVLGLYRARRTQASPHRRRALGAARHHDACRFAVAAPALRRSSMN